MTNSTGASAKRLRKREKALLSGLGGFFSAGLPAFGRVVNQTQSGEEAFTVMMWDVMFWGLLVAWATAIVMSCYLDDDHPYGSFFVGLGLPGFVLGIGGAFLNVK